MRGVLPNADGDILPGLYTRVRVPLEQRSALLVPEVAVAHDQQGAYLLVVNDAHVVERRNVTTGPAVESRRVVTSGISGGEWVIVNGLLKAAPGRTVTPEQQGGAPLPGSSAPPSAPEKKPTP
jgi:multidrug efflux pump subunit AcrA (membrane-fusion protein)